MSQEFPPTPQQIDDIPVKQDNPLIQITASKAEIDRRISAFIERKQTEIDSNNRREFCHPVSSNEDPSTVNSCARTDAMLVPRGGGSSHIKVSQVMNPYGPQGQRKSDNETEGNSKAMCADGIEERLRNMEVHLNIDDEMISANPKRQNVYERLRHLENRILYLEGVSPEYFHSNSGPPSKRMKHNHPTRLKLDHQNLSIGDIDKRIAQLQATLSKKTMMPY
ncbi:unnamed protein product [Owenia fusiformis]|uniref:Uncharacterized protein n=1 Tax=Owenia fusiformis TaxID=6347 RepID=A0A8J1U3T7_OWEFU|nr:unnamed protein product [Owenia fusiformis]